VPVERHRAAEQPLLRDRVGEQAVAQRPRGDVRDLELDRVGVGVARRQVVEGQNRLLEEAAANRLGDVVQLVIVDAIDVEGA
jgi:hypothetical protein